MNSKTKNKEAIDIFRMCIVTKIKKSRKELIRIVKTKNNKYYVRNSNFAKGRSAYVSKKNEFINETISKKLLNKTFKTKVPSYAYELVKKELSNYENN